MSEVDNFGGKNVGSMETVMRGMEASLLFPQKI